MPHAPLERLDDNLWAVESDVPGIPGLERRMSIVRRADGGLLFYNAVPVSDAALGEIRALGPPAQLVIPQHLHMIDAHAFRTKLGVRVYAPARERALVAATVDVDGSLDAGADADRPEPRRRGRARPGGRIAGNRRELVTDDQARAKPSPPLRPWGRAAAE